MASFEAAEARNSRLNIDDPKATSKYIYENQWEDAKMVVAMLHSANCYVVSVQKKTKVGADGFMLALAYLFTTDSDDKRIIETSSLHIITAMSNRAWEDDMIAKAPCCLKENIHHHGQLPKFEKLLQEKKKDCIFIIDEIDVGNKEFQRMHTLLRNANILDVQYMKQNNIKFVLISATQLKELYDLYQWGDLHQHFKMTIPASYIGHKEFLERGIIKEFYSLNTKENAEKWVQEDVLSYKDDFRVHIVRVNGKKTLPFVQNACALKGVVWKNHTSADRLTPEQNTEYFERPLTNHIVLLVKGFLRRANLIPNAWKLRIGATHEFKTQKIDYSVQIQGLPGRMTGYWRADIDAGHKTGPHRTSLKAIEAYEKIYNEPFGGHSYQSNGFTMTNGRVVAAGSTMLSPRNILNLEAVALPGAADAAAAAKDDPVASYRIYSDEETTKAACKILGHIYKRPKKKNEAGFYMTSLNLKREVASLEKAIKRVPDAIKKGGPNDACRLYYPCYADPSNILTLKFVVIIRPTMEKEKIAACDALFPHENYAVAVAT